MPNGPNPYMINTPSPADQMLLGMKDLAFRKAQARNEALNASLSALGPESTIEDVVKVANQLPPEDAKKIIENWEAKNAVEQKNYLDFVGTVLAASEQDPKLATELVEKQALAAENSGDKEEAQRLRTWAKMIDNNPAASTRAASIMASLVPGGPEMLEGLGLYSSEKRKGKVAEADIEWTAEKVSASQSATKRDDLTAAQEITLMKTEGRKNLAYAQKALADEKSLLAEMNRLATGGLLTPEKKVDVETGLRKEFERRTENFRGARIQYEKVLLAAQQGGAPGAKGVGDVALIFAFMKMLDPGSVVRESEFAHAENTQGLYDRLVVLYAKAERGIRLRPAARAEFVELARKYMEASIRHEQENRDFYMNGPVKNYGLTPENIFPAPVEIDLDTGRVMSKKTADDEIDILGTYGG